MPNQKLGDLSRRQYKTLIELPARRGIIADRRGKELAVTIPSYSVYADPKEIENPKIFAKVLAKKLGLSAATMYQKIKNRERRFVWLIRNMNKEFIDELTHLKLRGLAVVEESARVYPNENLLSQVMGFVGREGEGLEGLELQYDSKLKGESRKIKIERDARGRPLLVEGRIFTDVPAGFDINLTIDHELQYMLERELNQAIKLHEADSALGIILDAQTSEILAMGNAPGFDPNHPLDFNRDVWRNRNVTDAFEPGSTIKSLLIAGALDDGVIKPNTKYYCEKGRFKIGSKIIHEADVHHSFENLTVSEILGHSSNIGSAKIALQLGDKHVRSIFERFGIGRKVGVALPGESSGILRQLPWRDHLLANISFGHGMTATPLQIATAYAAIANGGFLKTPSIIRAAINQETGEHLELPKIIGKRVLSAESATTMRIMLNAATSATGTGALARVNGFPVAGKTGTAQKIIVGQGYGKNQYISSFAGFIPANDPRFVIYVALDNPKQKYYGSEVAAPLFSRIAGFTVQKSGLPPILISEKNVIKQNLKLKQKAANEKSIDTIRAIAKVMSAEEQNKTPDFTGLTLREVYSRLRGTPIEIDVHGQGVVSLSVPTPGQSLPENKKIQLYFQ